jgi:hypothetical protein
VFGEHGSEHSWDNISELGRMLSALFFFAASCSLLFIAARLRHETSGPDGSWDLGSFRLERA